MRAIAEAAAVEQNKAITDILRVISSSPADLQPVFDTILSHALRLCEGDAAVLWQYDGSRLHFAAGRRIKPHKGATDPGTLYLRKNPLLLGKYNPTPQAALERRTVHVADVFADRKYRPLIPKDSFGTIPNAGTVLAIPLLRQDELFGVVSIWRFEKRLFSDKQIAMMEAFAAQAAMAIHNVRLLNETKAALDRQTATSEILSVISSSPGDIQPVLRAVAENAARLCEASNVHIRLLEGNLMRVVMQIGDIPIHPDSSLQQVSPTSAPGRAILERKPIHIHDILQPDVRAEYPDAVFLTMGDSFRTLLVVPLLREGAAVGTITARRAQVRPFSDEQIKLLQTFADQAVIAIENVRLFNETKEALEQQTATAEILKVISSSPTDTQPVFQAIAERAARICDASDARIFTVEGASVRYVAGFGELPMHEAGVLRPIEPGFVLGRALIERTALQVEDVLAAAEQYPTSQKTSKPLGIRTILAVPLIREGQAVGGIILRRTEVRPFSEKQVALLKTFADQAAIAIENVRLFNETKEALERQTATAEILKVISSSPTNVQPVFDAIVESAARLFGRNARIRLVEGNQLCLRARSDRPGEGDGPDAPLPIDQDSIGGRIVLERRALQISDTKAAGAPVSNLARGRATGYRAIASAPLLREDTVLGVIGVMSAQPGALSEKQMSLLSTFASQAVIAIENVRLFNETKEALEQQTASADVLGVISNSIADTKPVFDKILESCARLFEGQFIGIAVVREDGLAHLEAYHGPQPEALRKSFPLPVDSRSAVGVVIRDRKVTHYPDVLGGADVPELLRRNCERTGIRSIIMAPMLWEGQGIGSIFVGRQFVGPFSDKAIRLLKTFADQAAIAIQNARLFREIQEKSAQLEVANKHKSDFLANMSHELRTPLNAIIGFSEALMDRMFGEVNEKQADYLKDIHESGRHLLSLINDILDLSKIEAGRMELDVSTFHLPSALSNAMTLIRERAQRHGIELGLDVDQRLGEFQADERKFKQIMLNLLSNAVKFTPDGGRVDVCAKKDTDKIEIAVKDTGIGIAPEDQAAVFEEFKQVGRDQMRKAEGTGLGLALTRRFVELHGGAIRLESTPGKGSTFTVSLPLRQ